MVRILRTAALIVAFVMVSVVALGADAQARHSWAKYHWARTANPVALQLGDNVDATWDANLSQASGNWSTPVGGYPKVLQTGVVPGSTDGLTCAPKSGTVQVCNANYGNNGWLGLAQIWITVGSHIAQGVTKMNDYYWTPEAAYAYANEAEQQHVMCQEVGHTFGLGHTSEDGSSQNTCMDYYHNTSDADLVSTTPNAHDFEQLSKNYRHLDRFNTAAGGSTGSAVWVGGHAPDGTPHGASPARGYWYVQDLGNGRLLFTHVFWN